MIELIQLQLSNLGGCAGVSRQLLDALSATVRHAIASGMVGRVEFFVGGGDELLEKYVVEAGFDVVANPVAAPRLIVDIRCRPLPSMLTELARGFHALSGRPVEAREIPFDRPLRGCLLRLSSATEGPSVVASAVAFRDRRLDEEAAIIDAPEERADQETPGLFPSLSVVIRTQGRRPANLEEALACLAAQTCADFEVCLAVHGDSDEMLTRVRHQVEAFGLSLAPRVDVFPVVGGGRARPLNVALDRLRGLNIAFLDDDDLVTADWVETFLAGAAEAPGRVIRARSVNQKVIRDEESGTYATVGDPEQVFARRFDLFEHLLDNSTPIFSFALPRALVANARFCEELPVLEDWDFLLRMALAGGVHDTDRVTGVYHWWLSGESSLASTPSEAWRLSKSKVIQRLDAVALPLPPGSAANLVRLIDEAVSGRRHSQVLQRRADAAEATVNALLGSTSWRVTAPLRWAAEQFRKRRR